MKSPRSWKPRAASALSTISVCKGRGDGAFTHLVELDPLLRLLGAGVGHPECPELGPEEVGGVSLHGRHVEAENLGGEFGTVEQIVWKRDRETCLSQKKSTFGIKLAPMLVFRAANNDYFCC